MTRRNSPAKRFSSLRRWIARQLDDDYTDTLREANEDRVAMLDSEPPFTSVFIEQRTVTRTPWVAVRDDDSEATR